MDNQPTENNQSVPSRRRHRGGDHGEASGHADRRPEPVTVEIKRHFHSAASLNIDVNQAPVADINLRTLVESGAHFGHQTSRWSPAMAPYIYSSRNGVHILNLPKTIDCWKKARKAVVECASKGMAILFIGTKKQAQDAIVEEAKRCGAFYVAHRWLGGMLTNFQTVRKSVDRLRRYEEILAEEEQLTQQGKPTKYTKKERLFMAREVEKLDRSLGGIRDLHGTPGLVFVVDIKREHIAVSEAEKLDLPVVALVDTNCDPRTVAYPVPGNDDGTRAIRLFCQAMADAVLEGRKTFLIRNASLAEGDFSGFSGSSSSSTPVEKKEPQTEEVAFEASVVAASAGAN